MPETLKKVEMKRSCYLQLPILEIEKLLKKKNAWWIFPYYCLVVNVPVSCSEEKCLFFSCLAHQRNPTGQLLRQIAAFLCRCLADRGASSSSSM
jgi:hypothetical protein